MSKIFSKRNMLIIGVILLLGIAWYFFSGPSSSALPDIVTTTPDQSAADQLLNSLKQVSSLTLDGTIFSNPLFRSLSDSTQSLTPEPSGRSNPFGPLPSFTPTPSTLSLTTATVSKSASK